MRANDRISDWAAWGRSGHAVRLDDRPALLAFLNEQLGGLDMPIPPMPLNEIAVPPTRLTSDDLDALAGVVGPDRVDATNPGRAIHSVGKSYRDMVSAFRGTLSRFTDAVIYPRHEHDVANLLAAAAAADLAVVPFGGGTSVVGGVEPRQGAHRAVLTLDLVDLDHVRIDHLAQTADIGAGAFGPAIEDVLNGEGLTLGHFPQSFEFSTFGGWVATRGAGQQSTTYGKIEDMVQAVRIATPQGLIATRLTPASAAGPSVLQQIVGSEGVLGVITSGTARVRPLPECVRFKAYFLPGWRDGIDFLRQMLQCGLRPSVVRLSDPVETRWLMKTSSDKAGLIRQVGKAYLKHVIQRRGFDPDRICLCLLSFEGAPAHVRADCRQAAGLASRFRAVALGSSPGQSWKRERFSLPYFRDDLMARGVMVDTLETATLWSNVEPLDRAVRHAITSGIDAGQARGAVMAHVSHVYRAGASLYYTFLARHNGNDALDQWQRIKTAANRAIADNGGTLSHHHGIGYEHQPLAAENGPLAVQALKALKATLDPTALMNPEKLL
ncbi:MAG: FAD-binding oxidoreductase [Phycisphaerae bacterium]|nr:FAD-binding oxidoreductase [Phycisphaerae bacterium]